MPLPLLCKKSEAILQMLVGLTTGQADQQSAEIATGQFEFLKFFTDYTVRIFIAFNEGKFL